MAEFKIELFSNVNEKGELQNNVRQSIKRDLLKFAGKRVKITIERQRSTRSHQQNAYLHLLFTIFKDSLNELGNDFTMDEIKELCKFKFATIDIINEDSGEVFGQRIKGTHEMKKMEMVEFIDKIIIWAADHFGIILPYPSEQLGIDLE